MIAVYLNGSLFSWAAGMQSFYDVSACGSSVSSTEAPGKERHFYIAAEEMVWDYAPSGMNYMTNKSLTEPDR